MLLLLIATQSAPTQPGFANLSLSLADCWPALNATNAGNAVFWDASEIVGYIDEAAKRLARTTGAFVERDESITIADGNATYSLPNNQINTIQADIEGDVIRPRNVHQLDALDTDWRDTECAPATRPKAFVQDTLGLSQIVLYPIPSVDDETLGLVLSKAPPAIAYGGSLILPIPPVLQDYFTFYALARARAKEGHGSMDEVVPWLMQVVGLYEDHVRSLWGTN